MSAQHFRPADHERARELAALRIDELLSPVDEAWLAEHIEACPVCADAANEYEAQHNQLRTLRASVVEPPRDLWARTAAAIEAERGSRVSSRRWRVLRGSPRRNPRAALAPVVAVVAIVVVVSAGLLNVRPGGGGLALATPIAIEGAADIQVLTVDKSGNLQLLSRRVDEVCPTGVPDCGVSPTFAVTTVGQFGNASDLIGAISPTGNQVVVVNSGPGSQGVYVLPVRAAATPAPTHAVATSTSSHAAATSSATATATASGSATPPAKSASPSPASPSAPASSPHATPSASASESSTPASASPSPAATPTDTAPAPSIEVSPAPDAAIRIASGVTVVGLPTYSPDGARIAFSAMPSDGSAGPDVYVWSVGDKAAEAITTDHNSWLADWVAGGIIVSRVDDGTPSSFLLDPANGHATSVGASGTWLPTVSPTGSTAAWWSGTVKLGSDGVTWIPDSGKLVVGAWPNGGSSSTPQVLAKGPLQGWRVGWDDTGSVLAAWINAQGGGHGGQLSLYSVDSSSGLPDLSNPMLAATPANPDFSLRTGRLGWTAPAQGSSEAVELLVWSGKTVYPPIQLSANGSNTVVP